MVRSVKIKLTAFLLFLLVLSMVSIVHAGNVTVTGVVNDNYQIVTDGQIYEIADTPEGNELSENHISAKVKVTGMLQENEDLKIITVVSYQVLAE